MRALVLVAVTLLCGCGDDNMTSPPDAPVDANFPDVPMFDAPCFPFDGPVDDAGASFTNEVLPIIQANCTNIECHGGGSGGLDLTAGHEYSSLVGPRALECLSGRKYVQPFHPEQSYLIDKLRGSICDCTGERMPLGGPYLDDTDFAKFVDWIAVGAPAN